jgi:hypothetical protein
LAVNLKKRKKGAVVRMGVGIQRKKKGNVDQVDREVLGAVAV